MIRASFRQYSGPLFALSWRGFSTNKTINSAANSPLFKLRQKTGLAYNLCREALNKHDNDINQAEAWLQAQALAHGLQKSTKLRGRSAKEGVISLALRNDNKLATLLELNCETDFVARNQMFKDLAISLTQQLISGTDLCATTMIQDQTNLKKLVPPLSALEDLKSQIAPIITRLGENIRIQRAFHIDITEESCRIFAQIHSQSGSRHHDTGEVMIGRFGAVVVLKSLMEGAAVDQRLTSNIGNRLCRHIIGFNPTYIELPREIREHLEAAEKEAKKTPIETSVEEELSDSEEEESSHNSRDDWPSLMDQHLIMSDDLTVRDYCSQNEMSILYFNRFECGVET